MTEYEKFYIAAVMKTVAPRNILTERRPCAERAAVRRTGEDHFGAGHFKRDGMMVP